MPRTGLSPTHQIMPLSPSDRVGNNSASRPGFGKIRGQNQLVTVVPVTGAHPACSNTRMRPILFVALLCCCSSSEPDENTPFTDCHLDDRVGTWRFSATEESGTCGPFPTQLIVVDDPLFLPENCTLDRGDWLSSNECELRRSFTCETENSCGPEVYVAITRQQSEDLVTGTVSLSGPCTDDLSVCSSVYAVRYERE